MNIDYNNVVLDRDDLGALSDTIGEALDNWGLTDEQLIGYWKRLPNDIKADAINYAILQLEKASMCTQGIILKTKIK
jgi:hypothetical protein